MAFNKQKALEAAHKAKAKGQLDKALKGYLRIAKEDPKDIRIWLKIGDLFMQKGAKQEATETYLKVAEHYMARGFSLKAVAVYKQVIKLDPRLVQVHIKLAELHRQLGHLSDAIHYFEIAAALFHREGKSSETLSILRELVELAPDNVATRIKLAELYSKEKMFAEAVSEFEQVAGFLKKQQRQEDYIKVAERILWHMPDRIDFALELAGIHLEQNQPRRALQKLQICFKADQHNVETLALLARVFKTLEQKGKMISVLKELARVLGDKGAREQAVKVHQEILVCVPDDADSRKYMNAILGKQPSAEQAAFGERNVPRTMSAAPMGSGPIVDESRVLESSSETPETDGVAEDNSALIADFVLENEPNFDEGSKGEVSAETYAGEIVKILTEADVYMKYGLRDKAEQHLQRVFELDYNNIEARERLKNICLAKNNTEGAVQELYYLADITASNEPNRAERYLRELLQLDSQHELAIDLARRFQLDIIKGSESVAPEVSDVSRETLEFSFDIGEPGEEVAKTGQLPVATPAILGARNPSGLGDQESLLEGSPQRPDSRVAYASFRKQRGRDKSKEATIEVSLDELDDEETGEAQLAELEELAELDELEEVGELLDTGTAAKESRDRAVVLEVSEEVSQGTEELSHGSHSHVEGSYDFSEVGDLAPCGRDLEKGAELLSAESVDKGGESVGEDTDEVELESGFDASNEIANELEEADFFISQELFEEAEDILQDLAARYPNSPEVARRLQDFANMPQVAGSEKKLVSEPEELKVEGVEGVEGVLSAEEPTSLYDLAALEKESAEAQENSGGNALVMLEQPLDETDVAAHFDLGLAYKDMGLFGEAIKEFEMVLDLSVREAQCYLLVGICYHEQNKFAEALLKFKAGLGVKNLSDAEQFELYYEIGRTCEALSNSRDAMHYYQTLLDKNPGYRDVQERLDKLRVNTSNVLAAGADD